MKHQKFAATLLLAGVVGLCTSGVQAQQMQTVRAADLSLADASSNVPARAGEASTMTHGVPNLSASNLQPGELGIQTRLTLRRATPAHGGDPGLKFMGGPGLTRPVMITPPTP